MTIDFEDFADPDMEDAEIESASAAGGGGNRLFVILAVALTGLIVLGLIAIGGVLLIRNMNNSQEAIVQNGEDSLSTPTLELASVVEETPTPTVTHTPVPLIPTDTPQPTLTPTNTPVVPSSADASVNGDTTTDNGDTATDDADSSTTDGGGVTSAAKATNTPVPVGVPTSNNQVPPTGAGGFELVLIAVGLLAVLFASRWMRKS